MKLFMFKSESKNGLHAFTKDPAGGQLPSRYQPWTAVGVVRPDGDPPHGLSRQSIELSIEEHGFQLWRIKRARPFAGAVTQGLNCRKSGDFAGRHARCSPPHREVTKIHSPGSPERVERVRRELPAGVETAMLKNQNFSIEQIYVPVKRRKTLNPQTVQEIAESMLQSGQTTPILVRKDGERLVLVEGLHRLEACRALGETTIVGLLVQARPH